MAFQSANTGISECKYDVHYTDERAAGLNLSKKNMFNNFFGHLSYNKQFITLKVVKYGSLIYNYRLNTYISRLRKFDK
jgi:hypothetical protein